MTTTIDPEVFGAAMGELVRDAVAPLLKRIGDLETRLASIPPSLTQEQVESAVMAVKFNADPLVARIAELEKRPTYEQCAEEFAKAVPSEEAILTKVKSDFSDQLNDRVQQMDAAIKAVQPKTEFFKDMLEPFLVRLSEAEKKLAQPVPDIEALVSKAVAAIPVPEAIKGDKGDSIKGDKGEDGIGLAGAVIDRDGNLAITMTNGDVKSLGQVVGRDGSDGIGLEDFDMEFDGAAHEVVIRASCAGRRKELRYPAGGIRPGGYWREGTLAKAGEVYTHDGSSFCAKNDTQEKPDAKSPSWVLMVRKGRDGERGPKGVDAIPPQPIKLGVGGG
jgi:hypothetical protein